MPAAPATASDPEAPTGVASVTRAFRGMTVDTGSGVPGVMLEAVPEGPGPVPLPPPEVVVKSSGPESVPVGFASSPRVATERAVVEPEWPSSSAAGACCTSSTPSRSTSSGSDAARKKSQGSASPASNSESSDT